MAILFRTIWLRTQQLLDDRDQHVTFEINSLCNKINLQISSPLCYVKTVNFLKSYRIICLQDIRKNELKRQSQRFLIKNNGRWSLNIADKHLLQFRLRIVKFEFWNVNCTFNKYCTTSVKNSNEVKTLCYLDVAPESFWNRLLHRLLGLPLFSISSFPQLKGVNLRVVLWMIMLKW